MKKYLKTILAATMIFSMTAALAGCGGTETTDQTEQTEQAEGADSAEGSGETLVMATSADFPPYEFFEGQEVVGIDADIAKAIGEKLGCEVTIEDMSFDAIIPSLVSGKADFAMAGMTVTEDRLKNVDFTDSYATGVQAIIVKEGSPIESVDDLLAEGAQNTVAVQTSTTGDIYTTKDIEATGLGKVERYTRGADAIAALTAGKVDCVVIDNEPAQKFVEANEGLKILDTEYITEDYAIALAKDSELTEKINTALQELIADGTVKQIIDTYITAE